MKIEQLKKATVLLNDKLTQSMRGQTVLIVNQAKAQIEFNNTVVLAITDLQQQVETLRAELRSPRR